MKAVRRLLQAVQSLDTAERILNSAALLSAISIIFPWVSGEWLGGERISYGGIGFYTSFIGFSILLLHIIILAITMSPLCGGPNIIRKSQQENLRLFLALETTILTFAALSVLTKITLEFSRMEVRFGIYTCLLGSLITTFEAFWKWKEQQQKEIHAFFHHPDETQIIEKRTYEKKQVPPPPPPGIENHRPHFPQ